MVSPAGASLHEFEIQAAKIGRYIVDFVCMEQMLVIELDGGQHSEQIEYDQRRDAWLKSRGYTVLRFWNNAVIQELDGV